MKSVKYLASLTAFAMILCALAFAKDNKSGSFDLAEPAHVGSTLLQPGHYKAEWIGADNSLQITILEQGKTVATTAGTMKELPSRATADEVTLKTVNGSRQVQQIEFNNRRGALMLGRM